jgi:hypothetical protein
MDARVVFALAALAGASLAPIVTMADDQPKLSCVKDFTFSQEFLAKYPKAAAACREVVMKNGMKWARFDANVTKVKGKNITADFLDQYDQKIRTLTFTATPDATVTVDGKTEKFADLREGDALSFWVSEARAGFYAKPGSLNSGKFAVVNEGTAAR